LNPLKKDPVKSGLLPAMDVIVSKSSSSFDELEDNVDEFF